MSGANGITFSFFIWAFKKIDELWDAEPNTPKGDRLNVLARLVEAYEEKLYKIEAPEFRYSTYSYTGV